MSLISTTSSDFNQEVFKKFIRIIDDEELKTHNGLTMFKHQEFLYNYMKEHNKQDQSKLRSRGLILYHRLGSGKSISALLAAEACRDYEQDNQVFKRKVILAITANLLKDPWIKELATMCFDEKCKIRDDLVKLFKNNKKVKRNQILKTLNNNDYHVIHYNANTPTGGWEDQMNKIPTRRSDVNKYSISDTERNNPFDDSVLIIDEVHNLLNTFANEITSGSSSKLKIYKLIINAKNCKLLFLSGTPFVNRTNELSFLFNMLRGIDPKNREIAFSINEEEMDTLFFKDVDTENIKMKNPNLFQRRINGLVSYFHGADESLFAKKTKDNVMLLMTPQQNDGYLNAYIYDDDKRKKSAVANMDNTTFFLNSIKNSNVVYPNYVFDKDIQRKMKLTQNGKPIEVKIVDLIDNIPYLLKPHKENEKTIIKIMNNDRQPLNINNELKNISIKVWQILTKVNECNGPVIIYSRFEGIYGTKFISMVLEQNGYSAYQANNKKTKSLRYMLWTGKTRNNDFKNIYNLPENKNGEIIKVFLMTGAGKEGINLFSVRQIHLLDPWWNKVINDQVAGRGIRMGSHKYLENNDFIDLQMNVHKRVNHVPVVNVFEYYSFPRYISKTNDPVILKRDKQKMQEMSIDYHILQKAIKKERKGKLLLNLMQKNSIDCKFFNTNCFIDKSDLNYINYWNVEDNVFNVSDLYLDYTKLEYEGKTYYLDAKDNVYEKNEQDFGMLNNKKIYKKIGKYEDGVIHFKTGYVNITKKEELKIENNIFSRYYGKKINFKKYEILDLSNGSNSIFLSKIFKTVYTIIPHDIIIDNKNEIKKIENIKIIDKLEPTKLKVHFLYIDYNIFDNINKINSLILYYPNTLIEHFNLNEKDN
jgi:hypothetical protein